MGEDTPNINLKKKYIYKHSFENLKRIIGSENMIYGSENRA